MEIFLPNHIKKCLNTLYTGGFDAFCVGGAVRDALLGNTPDDYDIATNAKPDEVCALFKRVIPTGIKHGTVTIIIDSIPIEITTFRTDGDYLDNRHPKNVSFVSDIYSDLSRRDFTVNAFAYSPQKGLIDNYEGLNDLNNKIIRCVGNPELRFSEDALRILRAFRFCSVLEFKMEQNTLQSAIKLANLLKNISRERIYTELTKLLCGKNPAVIFPLLKADLPDFLRPNSIDQNVLKNLHTVSTNKILRYCFFCYATNISPNDLLSNLKADNKTKSAVLKCFDVLKVLPITQKTQLKYALSKVPNNLLIDLIDGYGAVYKTDVTHAVASINQIISNDEPFLIKHLNISGDDIAVCGAKGRQVGDILEKLLNMVITEPELNNRQTLIKLAKEYIN